MIGENIFGKFLQKIRTMTGLLMINFVLQFEFQTMITSHTRLSFFGNEISSEDNEPFLNAPNTHRHLLENNQESVSLSISPSNLITSNGFQIINMTWEWQTENYSIPTYSDWIGIYSPPTSSNDDYLDWFYTYGLMQGSHQSLIWNMRDDYEIRYISVNYGIEMVEGISNIAKVIPHQPLQGHISLTKNSPHQMQIRWVSSLILDTDAMVQIGFTSKNYTQSFKATYTTYNTSKMCGSSASIIHPKNFRDPGYIYTVIVSGLAEDTRYYYRFGSELAWSDEQSFITESKNPWDSFGFIMYGDQGTNYDAQRHLNAVERELDLDEDIKLVLHIGDLSYAWGNGYNWDKWSNMISPIAMQVPYMITIGNHEYDHTSSPNDGGLDVSGVAGSGYHPSWGNFHDDSNGECGVPSYYRFDAEVCENGNSIFWYSFNYNSVHFVMLSSEHNYSVNTDGYNFLIHDLENIDHSRTQWIIVNIHRPLYESEIYPDDNIVDDNLLQLLEPIFYKYDVDMVLAGHFHSYQRTCAVLNYTCIGRENGGIVHLTIGSAGFELDKAKYLPNDDYILYRNEIDFGYGKFKVNSTHLIAQYVTLDNGIVDQVVLTKIFNDQIINQDDDTTIVIGIVCGVLVLLIFIGLYYVWHQKQIKEIRFSVLMEESEDEFDDVQNKGLKKNDTFKEPKTTKQQSNVELMQLQDSQ